MTITPTSVLLSLASTIPIQGRPPVQARPQAAAPAPAPAPDMAKPATELRAKMPQNLPSGTKAPPVNVPRGTFLDITV